LINEGLDERITRIEKTFTEAKERKKSSWILPPSCVFCDNDDNNKSFVFGVEYPPDLIADEIVRKVYKIEKGKEFPRVEKPSQCKLHQDRWLTKKSCRASGFIGYAIMYNDIVDVNPVNTIEVLKLLTDFDTMDFIFHRNKERKGKETNSIDNEYYFQFACSSLRKVGKKWLHSLDPEKYDLGYRKWIDEYGPNFARGGVIDTQDQKLRKKKQYEKWLDSAEKELGKGLVYSKNLSG